MMKPRNLSRVRLDIDKAETWHEYSVEIKGCESEWLILVWGYLEMEDGVRAACERMRRAAKKLEEFANYLEYRVEKSNEKQTV